MLCKICIQLEEAVAAAASPDSPEILQGLTEAGKRNRALQKEEMRLKTTLALEKHRKAFHGPAADTEAR
jgi:hypothetical protein